MSRELYLQQKLGDNRDKQYLTYIEVKELNDRGKFYSITGEDGKFYSLWKSDKYDGWENTIKAGDNISVNVNQKANKGGKHPWRNITPDIFSQSFRDFENK